VLKGSTASSSRASEHIVGHQQVIREKKVCVVMPEMRTERYWRCGTDGEATLVRQLRQEVGMKKRIEKVTNLDGEVLTHYHIAVMGTINHCRSTATVFCFNHILWHELALVGHILSLLKCIFALQVYRKPSKK
jgi:hypothetical protein